MQTVLPLGALTLGGVFAAIIAVVLGSVEIGFRLGVGRARKHQGVRQASIGTLVAATMGLLAFMLAFTFGQVWSRFDTRRLLVLEEANAIRGASRRPDTALLARHFPERLDKLPPNMLESVARWVSGGNVNSLSASYTLLALDAYAKAAVANLKLSISEIGKDGRERAITLPAGALPKTGISQSAARVQFRREGQLPAFYALNETGFDRNPPVAVLSQGVEIIREFLDLNGNALSRPKVGEEFLVQIRLRSTQLENVPQVAVVDLLPGGVEPVLELQPPADTSEGVDPAAAPGRRAGFSRLPIGLLEKSNWTPYHIDVRDDRIVLYGDVGRDARTFVYRVRATNAGVFQAPPPFAEGMYDRKIAGSGLAGKLEIVKP
jgi:hypothetical protein